MPYDGEFAQYRSLQRIVQSQRVNQLLGSYRVRRREQGEEGPLSLKFERVSGSDWLPRLVVAVAFPFKESSPCCWIMITMGLSGASVAETE